MSRACLLSLSEFSPDVLFTCIQGKHTHVDAGVLDRLASAGRARRHGSKYVINDGLYWLAAL